MANQYLDKNGVLYLWNKIGGLFATKAEVPSDVGDLANSAGYQTSQQVEQAITSKNYTTMTAVEGKGYQTSQQVEQAITGKNYTTMAAVEGKGYQTTAQVQQAINSALSGISGIEFSIVEQLPATGAAGTIYLVSKAVTATGNIYTEWIYVNNKWETLGDTTVDLSDYLKKTDISALTNAEIDEVTKVGEA